MRLTAQHFTSRGFKVRVQRRPHQKVSIHNYIGNTVHLTTAEGKNDPEWKTNSERKRYISPWNVSSPGFSSDDEYCNYCDYIYRGRGRQISLPSRIKQPILSNSKSLSPMSSSSALDDRFYVILSQVGKHWAVYNKTTSSVAPWLSKHLDSQQYW